VDETPAIANVVAGPITRAGICSHYYATETCTAVDDDEVRAAVLSGL
jgi:hypothetical protein